MNDIISKHDAMHPAGTGCGCLDGLEAIDPQAEADLAVLARIGGNEYRRRLADLVTRQQPVFLPVIDRYVAQDAASLAAGESYLVGRYSPVWAWTDTEGGEHLNPATFHGIDHHQSKRSFSTSIPEAAFDWPIYVAGIGLRAALAGPDR